jgi:tetratricopeptide (TPR) repeat protein
MTVRRFSVLIFTFGLSFVPAPARAQQPSHLQRGLDLFQQQQFEAALAEFEKASEANPRDASIENLAGIADSKLNRTGEAAAHYRRAIDLDPHLPGPHKNLGFNALGAKDYPLAETELKRALALDPRDPFVHYYLATLYLAANRDAEAVAELPQARALLDNDPENEFAMAQACLRNGHPDEARSLLAALENGAGLTAAGDYALAVLLARQGMFPEAARRFEHASALEPSVWQWKLNLGIAWSDAGDSKNAIAALAPLASEHPDNAYLLSLLGSAYEATEQYPQALETYRQALHADPENADRYLDYTRLLMDMNRDGEATQIVEKGIKNATAKGAADGAWALDLRLGVLQMNRGDYQAAHDTFAKIAAKHPEIALAHVALAQSLMQQQQYQEALDSLNQARVKIPGDSALEYYAGLAAIQLERYDEALEHLKEAIRLEPNAAESHYQLGKLYLQTEHLPEAAVEFERTIALDPSHSRAHFQLSRIYVRLGEKAQARQMADQSRELMRQQREQAVHLQQSRMKGFQPPSQ